MRLFLFLILVWSCSHLESPKRNIAPFEIRWSKNLDPFHQSGNLHISTGAPRIFNDILYLGSLTGEMTAYDVESGRVLWSANEQTELGAPVEFFKDYVVYGGQNGRLFVRHYLTGKLKYAIDLASPIESAPVFIKNRLLIYLRGHQLVQLDAETGKMIWSYTRAIPITTTLQRTTKPLLVGQKVIVGFADGYVGALSFQEGLIQWETKIVDQAKFIDADLNPLLVSGTLIAGSPSGELKGLNPDTGAISRNYGLQVGAHPVLVRDQLLLGTTEGEVVLMGLDGSILKKVKVSKKAISAVGWWKNQIAVTSFDGQFRLINPADFKVRGEFSFGHEFSAVYSDLVIDGDHLALFTSRNRLYVFK